MNKDQLLMLMYAASRIKANSLEAGEEGHPAHMGGGGREEGDGGTGMDGRPGGGGAYPWGKKQIPS